MDFIANQKSAWWRWLLAIGILGGSAYMIMRGYRMGDIFAAAPFAIFGVAGFVLASLVIVPETLQFATAPLRMWIDSIFLPGGPGGTPPLDYKLADHYELTRNWGRRAATAGQAEAEPLGIREDVGWRAF